MLTPISIHSIMRALGKTGLILFVQPGILYTYPTLCVRFLTPIFKTALLVLVLVQPGSPTFPTPYLRFFTAIVNMYHRVGKTGSILLFQP